MENTARDATKKQVILIVEDEETLHAALSRKLEHAGFTTVWAQDGIRGSEMIVSEKPDLVLLDIMLPKKNGIEILEDVRKNPGLKSIPIIIISNSGQPVEIKKLFELGINDYLVKADFTPEEVLEKVRKALGMKVNLGSAVKSGGGERVESAAPRKTADEYDILVAEDDVFLRELLIRKLIKEGYRVEEASDGNETMERLRKWHPKILLLDIIMPGVDGFEVLKMMQADPSLSKIPVIVISNLGQEEDIRRAKGLGARDYLIKAYFDIDEIIGRMKKVMEGVQ